jgi:hypothetical protein
MSKRSWPLILAIGVIAAILAGQAMAGDSGNGQKVTVDRGRFAHRSWSLAVQGRHRQRCYFLSLKGREQSGGTATCQSDRRRPPLWSRLVGISDLNDSATVELNVTRTRVRSMRLRIGHPRSDRPSEWIHVRTRRITRRQAHKAGVRRNFRFAVLHSRGNLCVKGFALFNKDSDRIEKQRVPCEF